MKHEQIKEAISKALVVGIFSPIVLALLAVAFFPVTVLCGWCDQLIWNWFGAPYFHLTPMTLWVAVGLGFVIRLQTYSKINKNEKPELIKNAWVSVLLHLTTLGIAYVIHVRFA